MKIPYCSKCGKRLPGTVPDDATGTICFACDNPATSPKEKQK